MFEVGKKYKNKYGGNTITPVAIANGGEFAWAEIHTGYATYQWGTSKTWEEVVEPHKEYYLAFKRDGRTWFEGPYDDQKANLCAYGTLIVTHHSETKVETEFHLKRK